MKSEFSIIGLFCNFRMIEKNRTCEEVRTLLKAKVWENLVKSVWRMPRHKKTMKDVAACDKLR